MNSVHCIAASKPKVTCGMKENVITVLRDDEKLRKKTIQPVCGASLKYVVESADPTWKRWRCLFAHGVSVFGDGGVI